MGRNKFFRGKEIYGQRIANKFATKKSCSEYVMDYDENCVEVMVTAGSLGQKLVQEENWENFE